MNSPHDPSSSASGTPPDSWLRARKLFDDVVTLPAGERARVLAERCGDDAELRRFVEALLRSDDAMPTTASESAPFALAPGLRRAMRQSWPAIEPGRRFGAFAVVEEIGRGGMGVVYLAERRDEVVVQRVALKLVPPDTLHGEASQRLARERRLLAALEHPNIARLIDAGEDPGGIPYFAMEYVQGSPILAYCDRLALSLADRLRLFRQVCAAVQYAHANLIVHCDIKANNILVTESGLPKLLDFGIATTLDAARSGEADEPRFFSPQTAAPEQFLGQPAGIPTDIYALGVLLCELCGGSRPFAGTDDPDELQRRVLQQAPELPSHSATAESARHCGGLALPGLRRRLAGDIDAIVAKALSKSPLQRYASVEQLDADVARHLETRPVQARAGERGYRFVRFVQRNALAVTLIGAVAMLLLVLAGSLIGFALSTAQQNAQLAHERDQAREREQQARFERARAQQVTDFLVGLFKAATPQQTRGQDVNARQLLELGSQRLRSSLGDQPQLKAAMLAAVGEAQFALDDLDGAESAAREAFALRAAQRPVIPRDQIDSLNQLATMANKRGRFAEALALAGQAEALLITQADAPDPVPVIVNQAAALGGLQRFREAVFLRRSVLMRQSQAYGPHDIRTWRAALGLSGQLNALGLMDESERVLIDIFPSIPENAASNDPEYAEILISLARHAGRRGDLERAGELGTAALAIYRKIYGDGASKTASALTSMAIILQAGGDYPRALQMFEESLAIHRVANRGGPQIAKAEYNVGLLLLGRMKRARQALPYLLRAVTIAEKFYPPTQATLANYRLALGSALRDLGRFAEAEAQLRPALTAFEAVAAPRGIDIALARGELACMDLARGRTRARAVLDASIAVFDRHDPDHFQGQRIRDCAAR